MHENAFEDMFTVQKWSLLKNLMHIMYFHKRAGKGRGAKIKSDKKGRGNHKKSDVPGGARGGWGPNNLTGA